MVHNEHEIDPNCRRGKIRKIISIRLPLYHGNVYDNVKIPNLMPSLFLYKEIASIFKSRDNIIMLLHGLGYNITFLELSGELMMASPQGETSKRNREF